MAIALISYGIQPGSDNTNVSVTLNSTGANLLVAAVCSQLGYAGSITDSLGNTWTPLTGQVDYRYVQLWYCVPASVGSGHTLSTASGYPTLAVWAFSGADPSPLDQQSGASPGNGTAASPGSITPSVDGCLLVTALQYHNDQIAAIGSGFVLDGYLGPTGTNTSLAGAHLIQGTAAAVNPGWTWDNWVWGPSAVMASFKPMSASPPLSAGVASFGYSGPLAVSGGPGIEVVATAPTNGSGSGPTYQWERSVDGGAYSDIGGATSLTLADGSASAGHTYSYRCKQTRGVETVATNAVAAQVYPGGSLAGSRLRATIRRGRS